MGYEDRILGNIDRRREHRQELKPVLKEAYAKARSVLDDPDYAIHEDEFTAVYPEPEVRSDIALGKRLRRAFDSDMDGDPYKRVSKQIADVLEAVLLEETELSEWLGGNAHTFKASDYDDFNNKVDIIAEWAVPGEASRVVGLAVDATYGADSIKKKLELVKNEIDQGRLRSIKYYKDAQGHRGPQSNVPRVVIGVSEAVVEDLASLWVGGKKRGLGVHPAQRLFLIEIVTQLNALEKYARAKENHVAAAAYREALAVIAPVEREKRTIDLGELKRDKVALEIVQHTHTLFDVD